MAWPTPQTQRSNWLPREGKGRPKPTESHPVDQGKKALKVSTVRAAAAKLKDLLQATEADGIIATYGGSHIDSDDLDDVGIPI